MAEKKNSNKTEPRAERPQAAPAAPTKSAETSSGSSSILYGIIGIALGLIIGFIFTSSLNSNVAGSNATAAKAGSNSKAGPLKGDEKMPDNHPKVDEAEIEEQVKAALEFGKSNQDYDSQLKVGAYLYVQARRYAEAKPFLLKAHELKPDEFEPTVELGNLIFDQAQETNNLKLMPEAAEWYEKALKIKPDELSVRTDLGLTYQLREPPDYNTAISYFDKSLAIDPKHVPTLYNKTRSLLGLKKFKEAEEVFNTFKAANPQKEVLTALEQEMDKARKDSNVPIPTH